VPLLFGKTLGAFTDLLKYQLSLLELLSRDILKRTFDEPKANDGTSIARPSA
jgi:hypothetical protein